MGVECFYTIIKSKILFCFDEFQQNADNSNDFGANTMGEEWNEMCSCPNEMVI